MNQEEQKTESFSEAIREQFQLKHTEAELYSPLVLAFIGDSVYETVLRTVIVNRGNNSVNRLNRRSTAYAKAPVQAAMIQLLEEELTEKERQIFKRGRNAKSVTVAKHATKRDYRLATGFEALIGFLYLSGQYDRLTQLIHDGMQAVNQEKEKQGERSEITI